MKGNAWAAVVVAAAALASVTTLAVTHTANPELLTFISGSVVPTVTMLLVGGDIKAQVNGRMSELIAHASQLAAQGVAPHGPAFRAPDPAPDPQE